MTFQRAQNSHDFYFLRATHLFYSHRNPELLNQTANQELCKVADWLRANKISLNIDVFHCDVINL